MRGLLLEKIEILGDLDHSLIYNAHELKKNQPHSLISIDKDMIYKHYSKSLVKNWIESLMTVTNNPEAKTVK